jgi:hypothetical protein
MFKHASITEIPEALLIKRLMSNTYRRPYLLSIRGIPPQSIPFQRVPLRGLPGGPEGDVDILLCVPDQPGLATAIEVKRIKVGTRALRNRRPNKLTGLRKGVRQANLLAGIGFWQVYLYVFVVVDSREQNAGRITYKGIPTELQASIGRVIPPNGLDSRVGLMYLQFVQPMDYEPLHVGADYCHLVRLAKPAAQSAAVTAWVAQVTAARPA